MIVSKFGEIKLCFYPGLSGSSGDIKLNQISDLVDAGYTILACATGISDRMLLKQIFCPQKLRANNSISNLLLRRKDFDSRFIDFVQSLLLGEATALELIKHPFLIERPSKPEHLVSVQSLITVVKHQKSTTNKKY